MNANVPLTRCWPGRGGAVPNVGGMKRQSLILVLLLAGCSSSSHPAAVPSPTPPPIASPTPTSGQAAVLPESNPPGDIPDNVAFVPYSNSAGRYGFTHPEGWAETTSGSTVRFTDKLNGVQALTGPDTTAPSVATAQGKDVPALRGSQAAFELRGITAVTLPAGLGVRIVYRRNSAPDAVTGRQYRDEVERYELVSGGREVVVELFGPVGSDNVDAYRTMISSLRLR